MTLGYVAALFFFFLFLPSMALAQECDVSVLRVKDGDTFMVRATTTLSPSLVFQEELHIHLARVKTLPLDREEGLVAKQVLEELIKTRRVGLTIKKLDGYGGYVAEVYLCGSDGLKDSVNDAMIAHGWAYKPETNLHQGWESD